MAFRFILYTVPDCPDCNKAKELIESQEDMGYGECSLETQEQINEFHRRYGHTTVPQVYLATEKQEYIGNYEDLEKFMLEAIDSRRRQTMIGSGFPIGKTVTVREHGNKGISVTEEDRIEGYNVKVKRKEKMKDITPYDT